MRNLSALMIILMTLGLAACDTDVDVQPDDNLSGTENQFDSMEQPCTAQAQRLTGATSGAISVTDRIRTGGGPILTLDAAGTLYTCRLENDGSVTVFSEFAN